MVRRYKEGNPETDPPPYLFISSSVSVSVYKSVYPLLESKTRFVIF